MHPCTSGQLIRTLLTEMSAFPKGKLCLQIFDDSTTLDSYAYDL